MLLLFLLLLVLLLLLLGITRNIFAKFNNNELNEEVAMLYESFNTITVIFEASNYYNSVRLL